jgi:23S rRNA pseudouridine1911/1915/1917 synthase
MVVHPAFGHPDGTLVNALLSHLPDLMDEDQPDRPGIVHRLDMETSGLIVVAKSGGVRHALQAQFKGREVTKTYLALVEGQVKTSHGIIEAALGRDLRRRKRIAVVAQGRPSVTEYRVLERFEANTYLEVEPHTGRTHQIRVHLAYIGHPVVGDTVYGYRKQRLPLKRHFLHAAQLTLHHPYSGELLEWVAPLPDDLQYLLDQIRKEAQLS